MAQTDVRQWLETDRLGEWLSTGSPLPGVELMSVRGSERACCEPLHEGFTVAAIARDQPRVEASWHTRCRSLSVRNGQLMCINAGDGHFTDRVSGPTAFDVVKLSPRRIADAARDLGLRGNFWFRSPACEDTLVFETAHWLVRAVAQGEDGLERESAVAEFTLAVVTRLAESNLPRGVALDPVRDYRLRRIRDALRDAVRSDHRVRKPTLGELAREANLTTHRLCTVFKKAYGSPIGEYWTRCRTAEAERLLVRGKPIKWIAAQLAFTDEPQFNRMFKRIVGVTPARWRDVYLNNSRPPER